MIDGLSLPGRSERSTFPDLDGDGGLSVARTVDYVGVQTWGGHAGPTGCSAYLSPADAIALAAKLCQLAAEAIAYSEAHTVPVRVELTGAEL